MSSSERRREEFAVCWFCGRKMCNLELVRGLTVSEVLWERGLGTREFEVESRICHECLAEKWGVALETWQPRPCGAWVAEVSYWRTVGERVRASADRPTPVGCWFCPVLADSSVPILPGLPFAEVLRIFYEFARSHEEFREELGQRSIGGERVNLVEVAAWLISRLEQAWHEPAPEWMTPGWLLDLRVGICLYDVAWLMGGRRRWDDLFYSVCAK